MKPISKHDEREIADYVKYNPQSLGSHKAAKSKALGKKVSKHYRGNTNSEGGIPFGKAPKGEK